MYINTLKQELSTAQTYEHNGLDETSIVDRHRCHMAAKFGMFVDFCWLTTTANRFNKAA